MGPERSSGIPTTLSQNLGAFLSEVARRGAPAEVRKVGIESFTDCIGTIIAGRHEEPTRLVRAGLAPCPPGDAQIGFSRERASATCAAFVNGVAAHVLDFDDVALRGHPSAVLVPAIVSLAQEIGCSGSDMLDAYAAGYEVWAELVRRESDMHHIKGWHPTGIFGAIGAAASCSVLAGLDPDRAAHALGLAATQSGGLVANFGSMAKPLHAGRAAQTGVSSARFAEMGVSSSLDALEHPRGFLAAVSPRGNVDRSSRASILEGGWRLVSSRTSIKKYPTCYYTHRVIDGLMALLDRVPLDPANVRHVEVGISGAHAAVLRNHLPITGFEAKFSIEFAVACALVAGRVGLSELQDEFVRSEPVQRLCRVVSIHEKDSDPNDLEMPGAATYDEVTVTTVDGVRHRADPVRRARGHGSLPLTASERRAKFLDCLQHGRFEADPDALFDRIQVMSDWTASEVGSIGVP